MSTWNYRINRIKKVQNQWNFKKIHNLMVSRRIDKKSLANLKKSNFGKKIL